jgi:pyruvate/2-oxoglutarate dehydrogenase complex dihydrolipoamide dehydrogenase (E3) component
VTIVQSPDRLINREDPKVGDLIERALTDEGITVHSGRHATSARREGHDRVVVLEDGEELRGEVIVVGAGRKPRLTGLGLENVGIDATDGHVPIDDHCRAADRVWAIGDVTGISLFTHVAKYHGRIASANILGQDATANYRAIPRVVFSDPEIAAVGQTEAQARAAGVDVATATIDLADAIARPYTYETKPRGTLGILTDRQRQILIGAWAVAPLASEWIHYAALAIRAEVPIAVLKDTVAQFPTYTEGFLSALRQLEP